MMVGKSTIIKIQYDTKNSKIGYKHILQQDTIRTTTTKKNLDTWFKGTWWRDAKPPTRLFCCLQQTLQGNQTAGGKQHLSQAAAASAAQMSSNDWSQWSWSSFAVAPPLVPLTSLTSISPLGRDPPPPPQPQRPPPKTPPLHPPGFLSVPPLTQCYPLGELGSRAPSNAGSPGATGRGAG